jgi:hypothetical protein
MMNELKEEYYQNNGYEGMDICVYPCPDPMFSDGEWAGVIVVDIVLNFLSFWLSFFLVRPPPHPRQSHSWSHPPLIARQTRHTTHDTHGTRHTTHDTQVVTFLLMPQKRRFPALIFFYFVPPPPSNSLCAWAITHAHAHTMNNNIN